MLNRTRKTKISLEYSPKIKRKYLNLKTKAYILLSNKRAQSQQLRNSNNQQANSIKLHYNIHLKPKKKQYRLTPQICKSIGFQGYKIDILLNSLLIQIYRKFLSRKYSMKKAKKLKKDRE